MLPDSDALERLVAEGAAMTTEEALREVIVWAEAGSVPDDASNDELR